MVGNAPHAMLLVISNPLSWLLKTQHVAVAAAPRDKSGTHQSREEPDLHLGSGHVKRGDAGPQPVCPTGGIPSRESGGRATHRRGARL